MGKGPVGKFFSEEALTELMRKCDAHLGDSIFLACGKQRGRDKFYRRQEIKLQKI